MGSDDHGLAAGWYDDPNGLPAQRWWDGEHWTSDVRPEGSPPAPSGAYPPAPPPQYIPVPMYMPQQAPPALPTGQATTSMILGIVGLPLSLFCGIGLLISIPALILGIVALRACNRGTAGGKGMAITGIATGGIAVGGFAISFLVFAVFSGGQYA